VILFSVSHRRCEEQEKVTAPSNNKEAVTAANSSSGKKRVVDDNDANGTASKRSKKKKEVITAANSGRVFSEEDSLVIQNNMIDFISKTGNDPFKDSKAFHSFMKDSIRAEISTKQLKRKIRDFKGVFSPNSFIGMRNFLSSHFLSFQPNEA
jgi:hypothetical protein